VPPNFSVLKEPISIFIHIFTPTSQNQNSYLYNKTGPSQHTPEAVGFT